MASVSRSFRHGGQNRCGSQQLSRYYQGDNQVPLFLLFEDYIDAQRGLSEDVKAELERFARNLGDSGALVLPFPGDAPSTNGSVLDKPWLEEERREVRQTPGMLMIDTDFDEFYPRRDRWVLFHFDRSTHLDGAYASKLRSLLQKIVAAISDSEEDPFAVVRHAVRDESVARATKLLRLEPGAFGISIDLRAGWSALKQYLRGRNTRNVGSQRGGG